MPPCNQSPRIRFLWRRELPTGSPAVLASVSLNLRYPALSHKSFHLPPLATSCACKNFQIDRLQIMFSLHQLIKSVLNFCIYRDTIQYITNMPLFPSKGCPFMVSCNFGRFVEMETWTILTRKGTVTNLRTAADVVVDPAVYFFNFV
jgi:hypothetical protein